MKVKRLIFLITGCVCLALGCVGIALPILPTVPFFSRDGVLLFAVLAEAARLVPRHENVQEQSGELCQGAGHDGESQDKAPDDGHGADGLRLCDDAEKGLYIPCGILACVWAAHVVYFGFRVRTIEKENN